MRTLGLPDAPLPAREDGQPAWPVGVVGSITHRDGCCGAVVALRSQIAALGFDVERASPLDRDLIPAVCTEREIEQIAALPQDAEVDWPRLFFSAKESLFKCMYASEGAAVGRLDMELTVDPHRQRYHSTLGLQGRFLPAGHYLFTAASLPA